MKLATEIVTLYHGQSEAQKAEERFKIVFQRSQIRCLWMCCTM